MQYDASPLLQPSFYGRRLHIGSHGRYAGSSSSGGGGGGGSSSIDKGALHLSRCMLEGMEGGLTFLRWLYMLRHAYIGHTIHA